MKTCRLSLISLSVLTLSLPGVPDAHAARCTPTPWDEIGPFYRPNPPLKSSIGKGYLLSGTVRSSADCAIIPDARIEFWQTSPSGGYDDAHRATVIADRWGRYRLETSPPPGYGARPPHIHILVDAKGFEGLITQHYPKPGARRGEFDLVLVPEAPEAGKAGGRVEDVVRPGKQKP